METQKTPNSKTKHTKKTRKYEEKKEEKPLFGFRLILQSYSHQKSIVLAQKQTHRLMEQNNKP